MITLLRAVQGGSLHGRCAPDGWGTQKTTIRRSVGCARGGPETRPMLARESEGRI